MMDRFDDKSLEKLIAKVTDEDKKMFNFDANCIDWFQFLMEVHFPGVLKFGNTTNKKV